MESSKGECAINITTVRISNVPLVSSIGSNQGVFPSSTFGSFYTANAAIYPCRGVGSQIKGDSVSVGRVVEGICTSSSTAIDSAIQTTSWVKIEGIVSITSGQVLNIIEAADSCNIASISISNLPGVRAVFAS